MNELLGVLKDTPLPTILTVAGIFFLLLAISGGLAGRIEVPANRQKFAAAAGCLLIFLGLFMHFAPTSTSGREAESKPPLGEKEGEPTPEPPVATNTTEVQPSQEPKSLFALRAVIDDPDGYTNVRSMKSASSNIVTKVYEGEEFYTYIQDDNWWQVRTRDGKIGYMHLSRIKLVSAAREIGGSAADTSVSGLKKKLYYIVVASVVPDQKKQAIARAQALERKGYSSEVYSSTSGYYTVTLARLPLDEANALKRSAIANNNSPSDAYLIPGETFTEKVYPE